MRRREFWEVEKLSEPGFMGFVGFSGLGSCLNCDLCDLGITKIERGWGSGHYQFAAQKIGVPSGIGVPSYREGSGIGVPSYKEQSAVSGQPSARVSHQQESGIGVPSYRRAVGFYQIRGRIGDRSYRRG